MTFGSLFAGIGGFDLGLERAGLECKWQVENDPWCVQVLERYWPNMRRVHDIRNFPPSNPDQWKVDVLCGGFPCQDISTANSAGQGLDGARSGLWSEYFRIIRLLRPRFVVVENVSNLLVRGIGTILGQMASIGFDAEWACIPACSFGAPHIRDRVYILAYPNECRAQILSKGPGKTRQRKVDFTRDRQIALLRNSGNAERWGLEGRIFRHSDAPPKVAPSGRSTSLGTYLGQTWATEPDEGWLDDGLSGELAEFFSRGYGNAVVPQIAEWIGRRLIEAK